MYFKIFLAKMKRCALPISEVNFCRNLSQRVTVCKDRLQGPTMNALPPVKNMGRKTKAGEKNASTK